MSIYIYLNNNNLGLSTYLSTTACKNRGKKVRGRIGAPQGEKRFRFQQCVWWGVFTHVGVYSRHSFRRCFSRQSFDPSLSHSIVVLRTIGGTRGLGSTVCAS